MIKVSSHICEEVKNSRIIIRRITFQEKEEILNKIYSRYIEKNRKGRCIWEKLKQFSAVNDSKAWAYLKNFVNNKECIMFFNQDEDQEMFLVHSGEDLHYILSETYGYEFYITDREGDYLLCFNDHDILYGCGSAEEWVNKVSFCQE